MRTILYSLFASFFLLHTISTSAQVNNYTFTESAGSYTFLGGTNSTASNDDGIENGIAIGFNFIFGSNTYTHFCISTNGWIKLGNAATTTGVFSWVNELSNTSTHRPLIAALWDDNNRNAGAITYSTTGTAPGRVLTVDWNNVNIGGNGAVSGTDLASFQIKLYETTNVVELIYASPMNMAGALSASVGLNDNTGFLSVTPGAPGTVSGSIANNNIAAVTNVAGKKYTFTPPSCLAPAGLSVTAITSTSATTNWSTTGGATGYEWAVSTSAIPPASGTATALTTASISGLTPLTVYFLHVRTACGTAFSSWTTASFTTNCNPAGIPYIENFDGVTPPAVPLCTGVENVNGATTWVTQTINSRSGPNNLSYPFDTSLPGDDWFFTAPLNLTAGTSYQLSFWYRTRSPLFTEALEVKYGNINTAAAMSSGTLLFSNTNITTPIYTEATANFTPAGTGVYYIGFHNISLPDQFYLHLDDISVTLTPSCGVPTALNAVVTGGGTSANLSWSAPALGTPTGYEWAVTTSNAPPVSGTAATDTSATASGLTANTQYYLHVRTNCGGTFSNWASFAFFFVAGDEPCGAMSLTLNGLKNCSNSTFATSVSDTSLTCDPPNNTFWYTYTPVANGIAVIRTEIPGAASNPLHGWVTWYTAAGTCPALTLTRLGNCSEFGQTGAGDVDSLVSPALTAGTTYYIMIDGFDDDNGEYCISVVSPPAPPPCITNITPANGVTGVPVAAGTTLKWNAAAGATSYDVFLGAVNPPAINIANVNDTTVNITGLSHNSTYYWYVAPKNMGGTAAGCQTNTTSFTTENSVNCELLYSSGCSQGDSITYFSLKGEPGSVIYNNSGGVFGSSPLAYSDFTTSFIPPVLIRGNAYSGFMRTGSSDNYVSIWIDADDDGLFENDERLMNNLRTGTSSLLYNLFIPATMPIGVHRMRVRAVYYVTTPAAPTDPCNLYTYGETEDYRVNIQSTSPALRNVSAGVPGSCLKGGDIVIDSLSNMSQQLFIPVLDSLNNLIAQIYPNGNNLGRVTASVYVNNGPVRQDPKGIYYLDRNITITPQRQPTGTYNLRLFYKNTELAALIAQPGSGVLNEFDLQMSKTIQDTCSSGIGANVPFGEFHFTTGFGNINGDGFLDYNGLTSFSTFYFHTEATPLPVSLLHFAGNKEGNRNVLRWTTATEQNASGFYIQRSQDGRNWESLGFVPTQAPGGSSSSELNYIYYDNLPAGDQQYYRLQLVDINGNSKLSNVVRIRGLKPSLLTLAGLYPNPATSDVNVMIESPVRDRITVLVADISGKVVMQKDASAEAGNNTVSINVVKLTRGTYIVKVICKSNCETVTGKFVKQ